MKKMILSILAFLLVTPHLFPVEALPCYADEGNDATLPATPYYACALSYDVYIYADQSLTDALFAIPYTYYVKVLSIDGNGVSLVEYGEPDGTQAVRGYCKNGELYAVDFIPARPFLTLSITATYTLDGNLSALPDDQFSSLQISYAYYGNYTVGGNTFCYVLSPDGKWGYLPKPENFSYELNADFTPPQTPIEESTTHTTFPVFQIIFAVVIFLLSACVLYFLLRKREQFPPTVPVDDMELEFYE